MKLFGIKLFGAVPEKIIRKGNQFSRTKTLVTKQGNITAKLENDTLSIIGANGKEAEVLVVPRRGSKPPLSQEKAKTILFNNFEHLFDPKYDAMPAIKKAISLDNFEREFPRKI
ncbi:hypothetical protein J6Q66_01930 [bacterium]|nr:hypothetical protein [bacterium]